MKDDKWQLVNKKHELLDLIDAKCYMLKEKYYNILEKKITIGKQIEIGKRIRDLFNTNNYILLALEQNSSIAILQKN